jgi:hypothetical protein
VAAASFLQLAYECGWNNAFWAIAPGPAEDKFG